MDNTMNARMQPSANGGGPEPQVGGSSNPGGQTDTGGLGTKYFESARGHMGGDEGVQGSASGIMHDAVDKPTSKRMGQVQGTPGNAGQRGGQNTGTSGNQTSAARSRDDRGESQGSVRYGATQVFGSAGQEPERDPGGTRGGTSSHGIFSEGGLRETGSRPEAPAGFAAATNRAASQERPPESDSSRWEGRTPERTSLDRTRDGVTFDDVKSKASEMGTEAKRKSKGFMNSAKNKLEDFFDSDIDGDGFIGAHPGGGSQGEMRETGTYPYDARSTPKEREMSVA